jgi:hypothetical protein
MDTMNQTRWRSIVGAACACWLLGAACAARAEPSASERETARSLMDEGDKRRIAGDLWGARERFQAANEIMHVPTTAFELARVETETLQLVEARATALAAANMPVQPNESPLYPKARADAARLAMDLAPRVPDVTVIIEPQTSLNRLAIDGVQMPRLVRPLPFKLNPGAHVLSVEAPGYVSDTQQFSLAEAQHAELHVLLKPAPALAAAPDEPATAPPRASATRDIQPYPAARTRGFVAAAIGGVVLATGVASGIWSAVETGAIRDLCHSDRCPEAVHDRRDIANTLANIANVTVPIGVVGLGYGLFEILTHPYAPKPRQSARAVRVSIDPLNARVTLRGAL